ncbi:hypothetical protein HMPREF0322_02398 [Desulfitobacterium hafniense DP7]|uniref:Uncharacterized protein n=1 Tax=Desulfitobacterium hafniense DP7 TaxID=537010 RepID=G9XN57_DESHA|nr:hypothetical protein HMPREF0322_02398 [Desulfitobacterium hafniense DP7]
MRMALGQRIANFAKGSQQKRLETGCFQPANPHHELTLIHG